MKHPLEELITPYLLGDLDLDRAAEVKAWIATDPVAAATAADCRQSLSLLHDAFADPVLVSSKGLARAKAGAAKARRRRERVRETSPTRIPFRLLAHAAGIIVFFGFGYLLIKSMIPTVTQTAGPSYPLTKPPIQATHAAGSGASTTDEHWHDFGTAGLRLVEGYSPSLADGVPTLQREGAFVKMSNGIQAGMAVTPDQQTMWTREQTDGARHWTVGGHTVAGEALYVVTLYPADADFGSNPKAWPANFEMTAAADDPTALAELMLMAASYHPAPSKSAGREVAVDADIARAILASGSVQALGQQPEGAVILKTKNGFSYVADGLDLEAARKLAPDLDIE